MCVCVCVCACACACVGGGGGWGWVWEWGGMDYCHTRSCNDPATDPLNRITRTTIRNPSTGVFYKLVIIVDFYKIDKSQHWYICSWSLFSKLLAYYWYENANVHTKAVKSRLIITKSQNQLKNVRVIKPPTTTYNITKKLKNNLLRSNQGKNMSLDVHHHIIYAVVPSYV